jgi:multiple sugar transport system substrate-binding protein
MSSMKRALLPKAVVVAAAAALLAVTGCSSDSDTSTGSTDTSKAEGRGPITYVEGKDTTETGVVKQLIDKWNETHPNEKVTFKEQTNSADQQHDDLVQHLQAKLSDYDVVAMDVPWTAEFAANQWIQPLKEAFELNTSALIPATVASATYNGTLYAAPKNTNGGLLYYRKDLVPNAPATWAEMIASCPIAKQNNIGCYSGQYKQYEGLTVNTAEAINSAGGKFVGPDGKTPVVDSPESRAGLQALVDGFKSGDIPAQAIEYDEPKSQEAFEKGQLLFLRNWPNVYASAEAEGSLVQGKVGVAPLPGVNGKGTSTLGGYNVAISAFSKNKATALDFLRYLIGEQAQRIIGESSLPPVLTSLYDDPALIEKMGYLPTLKEGILNAVPRPVTPFYPAVSKAIQDNAYAALKGDKSVDQAIKDMQAGIASAGR